MKEGGRRRRREARDKMEQEGGDGEEVRGGRVMAVASRAGLESSGLAAWGEVYGAMVDGGGGVKKDTKARRESLNDKRSGQLGLGRQGPKGAAG